MRTNKKWIAMLMSLIAVLVLSVLGACTTFEDSSEQGKKLDSIELGTDDVLKEYTVGDELSTEGLVVTAHYSDETTAAVTEFTATANGLDENGKLTVESDTVTVSYTEGDVTETGTYTITVTEAQPAQKTLTSIEVNAGNAKKEYTVGDELNTEGLVVTAHYSDETTAAVTEFTATANGTDENGKLTVESDTVTVSYTEGDVTETATYTITVTEPAVGTDIASGGEFDSMREWKYWAENFVTVNEAKLVEGNDGVNIHVAFSSTGDLSYGFQLFYNDTDAYKLGSPYLLTLTVTSKTDCTVTINGQSKDLKANEPTMFEVTFAYSYKEGEYAGISLFDMQVAVTAGGEYDLTLENIKWKAEDIGEIPETYDLAYSTEDNYVANADLLGRWVYFHYAEQNGAELGSKANGKYDHSTVTLNFTENTGNWWCTQLFYKNTDFAVTSAHSVKMTLLANFDGSITVNHNVYALVNGEAQTVEFNFTQDAKSTISIQLGVEIGNIIAAEAGTLTISDITFGEYKPELDPVFTATGASVEADGDKAYFVISGSYEYYEEAALTEVLTNAYFDLQKRGDDWYTNTKFEKIVNVNAEDKTWQIKYDVTSLDPHGNPYTSHFLKTMTAEGEKGVDLKLSAEQAIHESSIEVGDKTYTLINYKEFTSTQENNWGEPYNWGVVSLKVTGALMYTGATIESGEDAIYLVLSAENNKYSEEELKSITIYDGDKDAKKVINIFKVVTEADKNVKLYFDVKELDVNADGGDFWFFTHWAINGIEKVDVKCPVTEGAVQTDEKVYRLTTEHNMPVIVVAKKYFKFTHAALEQEGDQVYLVLSADNFLYTEEELKTIHYFEKDGEAEKAGMTLTVEKVEGTNGLIKLYFNFTNEDPNGKWWWGHWSIKGEIKGDVNTTIEAKEITLGGNKYSLWAQGEWNQVVVKVEKLAGSVRSLYGAYYPDADTFYLWFEVENFTMDDLNKVELLINGNGTEKTPANIIKSSAPILQCQLQFNNMKSVLSDGENILSFKLDGQVYKTLGVNESVSGSHKVDGKVYTISKNENNEAVITVTNDTTDPDEPADKAITNVYNFEFSGIDTISVWFQTTGYEMDDLDTIELYVNGVGTGITGDSNETADAGQYHVVFHGVKSALKDDRNVITFNFNGQNYTLPDDQNILGVTTYTEDGKVYTITKENNEIVVTVTAEGSAGGDGGDDGDDDNDPVVPADVPTVTATLIEVHGSNDHMKLLLPASDPASSLYQTVAEKMAYVKVNGEKKNDMKDMFAYGADGDYAINVWLGGPVEIGAEYSFEICDAEGNVLLKIAAIQYNG